MKYLYIILILILLILIMPIKIKISKTSKHIDVDVYFVKIFNVKLDFDKLMKKLLTTKYNPDIVTINGILYNMGMIIKSYGIIKEICSMIVISKMTWIYKINFEKEELEVYATFIGWNTISYFRSFLISSFKNIKNEYYSIQTTKEVVGLSFEMVMNFRLIYLFFALFKKIKDIPKIIKFHKKGSEKNA